MLMIPAAKRSYRHPEFGCGEILRMGRLGRKVTEKRETVYNFFVSETFS